jgi:O-antigen/teichoic acid export membrane protein
LITASQVILIAKGLGLEAAAVWSVTTRAFTLVCQLVWRVWGNSMPVLSEMHVRGESERLWRRYGTLVVTASVGAVAAAVLFAALNGSFVQVWTGGRIAWPVINDWLLAIWLLLLTQMGCHNSLLISLKEIRALKFIYLLEGVSFVVLGWWALKQWGFTGMLVVSIGCTAVFTWAYGTWRAARLMTTAPLRVAWHWQRSSLALAVVLVPSAIGLQRLVVDQRPVIQLAVLGVGLSALAAGLMWAVFLPRELVNEVITRLRRRRAG